MCQFIRFTIWTIFITFCTTYNWFIIISRNTCHQDRMRSRIDCDQHIGIRTTILLKCSKRIISTNINCERFLSYIHRIGRLLNGFFSIGRIMRCMYRTCTLIKILICFLIINRTSIGFTQQHRINIPIIKGLYFIQIGCVFNCINRYRRLNIG